MAINRGTRKAAFVHMVERFSLLGLLGGVGWGIYETFGAAGFDILMNALRTGLLGFIGGTAIGVVLGAVAVLYMTIFQ